MVNGVFVCLYFLKAKLIYLKYLSCMRVYRVCEYRFLYTKSKYTRQRWSRGHKARGQGQGQGHKKNPRPRPRPRTALPRTEPLEAKDRIARGQGQGPRTQAQVFSKKKNFKNFFQAISNSLAYPEFIGISLSHKSNEMTSSKFFQRGSFCGTNIS